MTTNALCRQRKCLLSMHCQKQKQRCIQLCSEINQSIRKFDETVGYGGLQVWCHILQSQNSLQSALSQQLHDVPVLVAMTGRRWRQQQWRASSRDVLTTNGDFSLSFHHFQRCVSTSCWPPPQYFVSRRPMSMPRSTVPCDFWVDGASYRTRRRPDSAGSRNRTRRTTRRTRSCTRFCSMLVYSTLTSFQPKFLIQTNYNSVHFHFVKFKS